MAKKEGSFTDVDKIRIMEYRDKMFQEDMENPNINPFYNIFNSINTKLIQAIDLFSTIYKKENPENLDYFKELSDKFNK